MTSGATQTPIRIAGHRRTQGTNSSTSKRSECRSRLVSGSGTGYGKASSGGGDTFKEMSKNPSTVSSAASEMDSVAIGDSPTVDPSISKPDPAELEADGVVSRSAESFCLPELLDMEECLYSGGDSFKEVSNSLATAFSAAGEMELVTISEGIAVDPSVSKPDPVEPAVDAPCIDEVMLMKGLLREVMRQQHGLGIGVDEVKLMNDLLLEAMREHHLCYGAGRKRTETLFQTPNGMSAESVRPVLRKKIVIRISLAIVTFIIFVLWLPHRDNSPDYWPLPPT